MRVALSTRNAILTARNTRLANCYIRFYDGTRPANADTALASNNLLAELRGPATFGTVANGVLTAGTIADGTGTAAAGAGVAPTFCRVLGSDGTTVEFDLSVAVNGAAGSEVTLAAASINQNGTVHISSMAITESVGT